jgi:hypothetical protein
MTIKKMPWCVTCKFWSPYYKQKISGWCTMHQIVADSDHWCERHRPVITSKSTPMTPISETVQATNQGATTMTKTPQELAAYLRKANAWRRSDTDEPMPDPTELGQVLDQVIAILEEQAQPQTIARSECCEVPAVTAGKPNSTQWHVCPHCCQPCDVYF